MTRFKELRRIKMAIQNKHEDELRWALDYCKMRVRIAAQLSSRNSQEKHWLKIQRDVEEALGSAKDSI